MEKITAKNPFSYDSPDVPYDNVLPSISFSPIIIEGELKYQASLNCKLGREVDGLWDILPNNYYSEAVSDVSLQSVEDQDLALLVQSLNSALSTFITSRDI